VEIGRDGIEKLWRNKHGGQGWVRALWYVWIA